MKTNSCLSSGPVVVALGLVVVFVSFSSLIVAQTCGLQFRTGSADASFDSIFTQDGPGTGLEPTGAAGWTGGDSTYSIELPNGDTAFFFSDSYIGESPRLNGDGTVTTNTAGLRTREANCFPPLCDPPTVLYRAHNSVVIRNKITGRLTTLTGPKDITGYSTSYFAPPGSAATGHFYWMGDSAVIQTGSDGTQKLWVFLLEFDNSWTFHGSAIAQLSLPSLGIESIQPLLNLQDTSSVHWGTALYLEGTFGNYTLYVYGINATTAQKRPFVARTSMVGNLVDASNTLNWSVWNGSGWSQEFATAAPVIGAFGDPNNAADSISDEFSVKRVDTTSGPVFLLAGMDTTPIFGAWKDITIYTSCNPAGPFSAKSVVYSTPETGYNRVPGMAPGQFLSGNMFTYNPHLHTQFTSKGKLLISYNINAGKSSDLLFADAYRPRFIRVSVRGLRSSN